VGGVGETRHPPEVSTEKDAPRYTARLLVGCADRPGIVAKLVTDFESVTSPHKGLAQKLLILLAQAVGDAAKH
jgi:hypothetical protein